MASMTPEARRKAIKDALEGEEAKTDAERLSLPWKTSTARCTVIEVELNTVVLNHRSHRIRAQLESHAQRALVSSDPQSDEAQRVLEALLRETKGFDDIKASLDAEGQREPGVITRSGVLVNANTRAVALRDLGKPYIRVAVLPDRATPQQINELELRLQVRPDLKQDYTFTNTLLFIEECVETGWPNDRISRELGYAAAEGESKGRARVAHQQRMLTLIKEIREASNKRLAYSDFDDKEQALIELDKAYEKLKASDPGAALRLRSVRIAGMLANMGYRELRFVDDDFAERFLRPELEDHPELTRAIDAGAVGPSGTPDGADILGPGSAKDLGAEILGWITSTAGQRNVSYTSGGTKFTVPRDEIIDSLGDAMSAAAEAARAESNREDLIEQPTKRMKEARQKTRAALDAFRRASTDRRFAGQVGQLGFQIKKLRTELSELSDAVEAHIEEQR